MSSVHVIGAGPAGSIAAIHAIEAGYAVFVSEEHECAGIPQNCSGLFSKEGLETIGKHIDYKQFIINNICGADIYFDTVLLKLRTSTAVANVCNRAGFDKALAGLATEKGAKISYNERIKGNGDFKAKNIIAADGANSGIATCLGFPQITRYVGTLQKMVEYKATEKDVVEVFLSSKIPGFFGWVIPHNESEAEFGVGVELPHDVQKAWNYFLNLKGLSPENIQKPSASIIPVEIRKRCGKVIDGRNILLVGDAAGQTKATTGGGVVFGALCAEIAGKDAEKPAWYDLEWRARYGHEFILHRKIRDYLNHLNDSELRKFGEKLNDMQFGEYLEKHGHMDKPSKMITPELFSYVLNMVPGFGTGWG